MGEMEPEREECARGGGGYTYERVWARVMVVRSERDGVRVPLG